MDHGHRPVFEPCLADYFRRRLTDQARELRPPPGEETFWYLSSMLTRFGRSENFFGYEDGALQLRPLALIYGDALEASSDRERCLLMQHLGDMALFQGALFPERFTRRGIQRDYVISMGGRAYEFVAENNRQQRHVFADLARTFARMIDVVAAACARSQRLGVEDILALYQRWQETREPRVAQQLTALGIDLSVGTRVH